MGKFHQGLGEELSLYVRQIAWLNAAPEDPPAKNGSPRPPAKSRIERMKADGIDPDMPEISAEYLVGYLWDVGPTMPGPAGAVGITNTELRHWQENSGICLQPWECRLLRQLSSDYANELHVAAKPDARPPFGELPRNPNLDKKLDAFLD